MSLLEQINRMQKELVKQMPSQVLETLLTAKAQMIAEMPQNHALKEGDRIPDFSLYNHRGEPQAIAHILEEKPLVISFYRGTWCPYCDVELRSLVNHYSDIQRAGAELVAISPELPDQSMSYLEKQRIPFHVLSDPGNLVARKFGIVVHLVEALQEVYRGFDFDLVHKNGDLNWNLPIPATYLVNRNGIIEYAYVNPDYTQRMEPAEIIRELRLLSLSQKHQAV